MFTTSSHSFNASISIPQESQCGRRFTKFWQTSVAAALATVSLLGSDGATAQTQTYPNRPIMLVVGFPPGGGSDATARLLAKELSAKIGQQVVIDNKPGGNTILATKFVKTKPADGYTLLYTSASFAINPAITKVGYDISKDFAPVAMVNYSPMVLITSISSPAKTIREVVAMGKTGVNRYSYGSFGVGSAGHIASELFLSQAGIELVHVPYKGSSPGIVDVMSGQIEWMMPGIESAIPLVKQGKLRAVAVSGSKRVPTLPDVPTFAEAGLPGYELNTWSTILAPAGTPPDIVSKLNASIREVLAMPQVREGLVANGGDPETKKTPAEVGRYINDEARKFEKVVRDRNIKAE